MTHDQPLDAGICSFCDQGLRRIVACISCSELLALCDECDAMWLGPDTANLPIFPNQPEIPCPFCGVGGGWEHYRAATRDELHGTRWEAAVRTPRAKRIIDQPSPRSGDEGDQDAARL
ncbi:MAG TPA: hypothetical protein DCQ98_05505 [Planctomycetaceae bacterium]|nr:hypothetical protein [Planctomycetaceae bacterium]HRE99508.1 hypothetical protein [Pirellulaceae bacterium]